MIKSDEIIMKSYEKHQTVKGVVEETGFSWNKIVKSLSSNGVVVNDTHRLILNLWVSGADMQQIADRVGISAGTVKSYIPRVRPVYGENRSRNAEKIREWRKNKQK